MNFHNRKVTQTYGLQIFALHFSVVSSQYDDPNSTREIPAQWLWAKTLSVDDEGFHALPYHLFDVGAAAGELWDRLPELTKARVAELFGHPNAIRSVCVFLAATHDIGKANPYFQAKSARQRERLTAKGVLEVRLDEQKGHGQATGAFLREWIQSRWNWSRLSAESVAMAVGGHHGIFFEDSNKSTLDVHKEPWNSLGRNLLDDLAQIFDPGVPPQPAHLNPFLGWLAGFVSVADWLGSHETMTVWEVGPRDYREYLSEAQIRAHKLLNELNWHTPAATYQKPLSEMVPAGKEPNDLQRLCHEIAEEANLVIVEAPTGEGKTEAAFTLCEPRRSLGGGIYFALPTRATANGLFKRVESYLQQATSEDRISTRLLHSQAWLFTHDSTMVKNPGSEGDEQSIQAHDWFAGSKRGLLAPFGVGTIDQALIASLRARHGFVRLFALAGKTVVIDEVHAYDTYMSDLLNVLMGWLRALGCQVILLSATLPQARRNALLRAWGVEQDLPKASYPCVTWVSKNGDVASERFEVRPRKPVQIQPHAVREQTLSVAGAMEILERIQTNGGFGALILNTVNEAQIAYDWLKEQNLSDIELDLFHARFTTHHRDEIEQRVLRSFGKNGKRNKRRILVATQVVEQSLDLDFDHMVSALCPIDLLIQRAGRLHRHNRDESGALLDHDDPDCRPNPVLYVLTPLLEEEMAPEIQDSVYSKAILLQTLHTIKDGIRIQSPSDVSLAVESVYSEEARSQVLEAWSEALDKFYEKSDKDTQSSTIKSKQVSISRVDDSNNLIVDDNLDLDENDERQGSQLAAKTRLEDRPSLTVALLSDESTTIHGHDAANMRQVMLSCLKISPPIPLWRHMVNLAPLASWRNKGSLSRVRPLVLDQGKLTVDKYTLTYSQERGLAWKETNAVI